ncbi:hypothetical protein BASA81_000896 [Batrachochytrium salamandrivorans]|nr:hypothetical protein BASA81_000896 [Batrachochytrium salamandrivorans]
MSEEALCDSVESPPMEPGRESTLPFSSLSSEEEVEVDQAPSPPPPPPPAPAPSVSTSSLDEDALSPPPLVPRSNSLMTNANRTLPPRSSKKLTTTAASTATSTTTDAPAAPAISVKMPTSSRYPRKLPNVDPTNFQAVVPPGPFLRKIKPPKADHPDLVMVCNGQTSGEVYLYLDFCRKLTGSGQFSARDVPLEEDEQALEFLLKRAHGNVDCAKLLLISSLGGGKESASNGDEDDNASLVLPTKEEWVAKTRALLDDGGDANEFRKQAKVGKRLDLVDDLVFLLHQVQDEVDQIDRYLGKVHRALSLHSARKLTTLELRQMGTVQAPKRARLHEVEVLLALCAQCEAWESKANQWLGNRDFALLPSLVERGRESVADHSQLVHLLEGLQSRYLTTMAALRLHVPPLDLPNSSNKQWKKHGVEVTTLPVLLGVQIALSELQLPPNEALDLAISNAQSWKQQASDLSSLGSMARLQQLLAKLDSIPVDLQSDKRQVEQFQTKAQDFLKRTKAYFTTEAPVLLPGATAAAKKLAKQQAELDAQSRDSASFLALKQEMIDLGLGAYSDTEVLREVLEAVSTWINRVHAADGDLDQLYSLQQEQIALPVSVQPHDRLLQQRVAKLVWSNQASELVRNPTATVTALEQKLVELDQIFDPTFAMSVSNKRTKRSSAAAVAAARSDSNSIDKLKWEDELRHKLAEYRAWVATAEAIVHHKPLAYDEFVNCMKQASQCRHLIPNFDLLENVVKDVVLAQAEAKAFLCALLPKARTESLGVEEKEAPLVVAALPIPDLEQLVNRHLGLGVKTPELALLQEIDRELEEWQNKFANVLRSVRKPKRHELPYRTVTENSVVLLRQETLDFPKVVDLTLQLGEIDQCLQATEEFCLSLSTARLSVSDCLDLFPPSPSLSAVITTEGREEGEDDARILVRLGLMTKDSSFPPASSDTPPKKFVPNQGQSDALLKMMRLMREAEKKDLHILGVNDAQPIRFAAWLIKAYLWLLRVDLSLGGGGTAMAATANKPLALCQFALDGTRLLHRVDYCGETFPVAALEQLLPSGIKHHATAHSGANPALDVYAEDDWAMLRHIQPLHVLDSCDAWANNSLANDIHTRLQVLRNDLQIHFAAKFLCKHVIPRLPNRKKTADTLRQLLASCPTRKYSMDAPDEAKLKAELAASEAWTLEFTTKRFPLETVDKIASRGDKLWVEYSQIESLRAKAKVAHEWMERAKQSLGANSTYTLGQLQLLLQEGEALQSIDVSTQLDKLRKAVDLVCMCRAPREDKVELMHCIDCGIDFHRECIKQYYANVCPFCHVFREVDRIVGRAFAAICRVAIVREHDSSDRVQALGNFVDQIQPLWARGQLMTNTVLPVRCDNELICDSIEVRAIEQALEVKKWSLLLGERRQRPTLEDLETLIRGRPQAIKLTFVEGLSNICNRGKLVLDTASQIWNLPLHTPSAVIVDKCQDVLDVLKYLPLDMNQMTKAIEACYADKAIRHCHCRRFDDGRMMLLCVKCELWFHAQCVGVYRTEDELSSLDFSCPQCELHQRLLLSSH